jgi:hypothetical protein
LDGVLSVADKRKSVSLAVGRGEKLPASKGAGLTAKGRAKYNAATGSKLTDIGLQIASRCSQLRSVDVRQCELVSDLGLRNLAARCSRLQEVRLGRCNPEVVSLLRSTRNNKVILDLLSSHYFASSHHITHITVFIS